MTNNSNRRNFEEFFSSYSLHVTRCKAKQLPEFKVLDGLSFYKGKTKKSNISSPPPEPNAFLEAQVTFTKSPKFSGINPARID